METVNELIKRGWTQSRIAAAVGVTQAAVSYWASGKKKPGGPARLLLKALLDGIE